MSNAELVFVGVEEGKRKSMSMIEAARGIVILDDDGFQEVGEFLQSIKAERKVWDARCDKAIDAAHKEWKARLGYKAEFCQPLDEAEKIAKDKMAEYDRKRKAEIAAEQKRLDDEARKVAEEKRRLEAERVEAENKIRRAKEAEEQKKRDAEIAKAKKDGDAKAAARMATEKLVAAENARIRAIEDKQRAEAAAAAPLKIEAVVKIEAPVAAGVSFGFTWAGEIIGGEAPGNVDPMVLENNLRLLVEAIAAKKAPLYLILANTSELTKMAGSVKGAVQIPGVRFFQKPKVTARG